MLRRSDLRIEDALQPALLLRLARGPQVVAARRALGGDGPAERVLGAAAHLRPHQGDGLHRTLGSHITGQGQANWRLICWSK